MFMRVNSKSAHHSAVRPRFSFGEHGDFRRLIEPQRDSRRAALETGPSYFKLTRKARVSRSVSDSFDRNI